MFQMNCKMCDQPFGQLRSLTQARILPCGHTFCGSCLNDRANHLPDVECPACSLHIESHLVRSAPVNHLYYEMLNEVNDFIERKEWEKNDKKDDEDSDKQDLARRVSVEYKCLYLFCHRLRYEKNGIKEVFCSAKCMELNEQLQQGLDEEAQKL